MFHARPDFTDNIALSDFQINSKKQKRVLRKIKHVTNLLARHKNVILSDVVVFAHNYGVDAVNFVNAHKITSYFLKKNT